MHAPQRPLAADPTAALAPIDVSERIEALDIVRGFALFGVLIANLHWWSQDIPLSEAQREALWTAPLDAWVSGAIAFAVDGKFITLFSFLFAVGFTVQLERGEARGANALPVYRRRLLVLLAIGLAHNFLLWMGDILHMYALLGFLLPLVRRWSGKKLVAAGVLLGVVLPVVADVGMEQIFGEGFDNDAERQLAWQAMHGGLLDLWAYYAQSSWAFYSSGFVLGFMVWVAGRFCFGLWAGRQHLLRAPERHRPLRHRLLCWGLAIGIVGNGLNVASDLGLFGEQLAWPAKLSLKLLTFAGILGLSAFYLAAILHLLERPRWAARLRHLAPVGRMALTNYLTHSLLYMFVFCDVGFGLVGEVGSAFCVAFALVVFGLQMLFSRWWLARHRFGPAEWFWRSLTYGHRV